MVLPLDDFIYDNFNTTYNDTSFGNKPLEKSDKSFVKKSNLKATDKPGKHMLRHLPNINSRDELSESFRSTSLNNVNNGDDVTLCSDSSSQRPSNNTKKVSISDETPENTITREDNNFQDETSSDDTPHKIRAVKDPNRSKPKYTLSYTPKITANPRRQEPASQPCETDQVLSSRNAVNLDPSVNHVLYNLLFIYTEYSIDLLLNKFMFCYYL